MKTSTLLETERAIDFVKETFAKELAKQLHLIKISSPIAVLDGTGINDDLNGIERPVSFPVKALGEGRGVVVHSLAKWKRLRLKELSIEEGKGILTDMRALRPDEDYSPLHSVYVDQWDWEKRIKAEQRALSFLKSTVESIYTTIKTTEQLVCGQYSRINPILPEKITFIHSEELLKQYPKLRAKERENEAAKKYGAVFIVGIGAELSNAEPHDGRAPDYDDWSTLNEEGYFGLNGDIILWHPELKSSFEISSMGIRVDKAAMLKQLEIKKCMERKNFVFHNLLLSEELPQSIGGGIGQSRVCMFMLRKKHIGEVQVGIWHPQVRKQAILEGLELL